MVSLKKCCKSAKHFVDSPHKATPLSQTLAASSNERQINMNYYISVILLALICQFQTSTAEKFLSGHYYTKEGKKIEGLIKYNRATFSAFGSKASSIKYKASSDDKPIKLTAEDITSFVIGADSFAIIKNFKINSVNGEYEQDFAQVIERGPINLFMHRSASSDGKVSYDNDRYVISNEKNGCFGIWNFVKQREEIAKYFSARPDLVEKILNKKDETPFLDLVRDYNKGASR